MFAREEFKPKNFSKFTRFLLYLCTSISFYCTIHISSKLSIEGFDGFDDFMLRKRLLVFVIATGLSLFTSWSSGIAVHKSETSGKKVKITKKRSKQFAKFIYFLNIIMLMVIIISIIDSFSH